MITPVIGHSAVVRNIELKHLLDLESVPRFVMTVANTVRDSDGQLDYGAPDKLLQKPPGTIGRIERRLLNTLRVVADEWTPADKTDTDGRPRYIPSLVIATSDASGPIAKCCCRLILEAESTRLVVRADLSSSNVGLPLLILVHRHGFARRVLTSAKAPTRRVVINRVLAFAIGIVIAVAMTAACAGRVHTFWEPVRCVVRHKVQYGAIRCY